MSGVLVATVMQAVGAAKDWLAGTVVQEPLGTKGYNDSKEIKWPIRVLLRSYPH